MRLFLIRHTTPFLGANKTLSDYCYGQSDLPLASSFTDEITAIKANLAQYQIDSSVTVISSPLSRCRLLAMGLFPNHPIEWEPRLMEMHFGNWELQAWSQIPFAEVESWKNDLMHYQPGAGESFFEVIERCQSVLSDLRNRNFAETDTVIIVTHSGPIRALMHLQLQQPPQQTIAISIPFGHIVEFVI